MASYEEYLNSVLSWTDAEQRKYNEERRKKAQEEIDRIRNTYQAMDQQAVAQYAQSAQEVKASYRDAYDVNAVSELVARRNAEEAIANSNLLNSGLNHTQQTAISLARSRADAQVTTQRQQILNSLIKELDALRTQYRLDEHQAIADAGQQAENDIVDRQNVRYKQAQNTAYQWYTDEIARVKSENDSAVPGGEDGDQGTTNDEYPLTYADIVGQVKYTMQTQGVRKAEKLLGQFVSKKQLTGEQKTDIMIDLGIRSSQTVPISLVEKVMMDIAIRVGKKEAKAYVEQMFDNNSINLEQQMALVKKIDRL